ncbi:MAG: ectonucleotide pyrophosphatase/phosphodiesterase [Gammaproteobacteria bacterium]
MRFRGWVFAVLILLAPLGWAGTEGPIVVLLSWDGMRHDYLDRDTFPALDRVAREGVRAGRLIPVFPSSTFPGHVSMATGTYPDRHGIVANVFLDQEKGRYAYSADANWIEAEPLWIAAERQGVRAATYFWVGSESDWHGQGTSYRIAPFEGGRPEALKVDQILAWLSLPEEERPRLIMSYWAGADSVGHDRGPNSDAVVTQIHTQDHELGRLLAGIDARGLWPRTTLIIVSDHGMTVCTDYLDLGGALDEAGIAATAIGSAVVQVHLKDPGQDRALEAFLGQFLKEVPGSAYYRRDELPAELRLKRDNRLGDWVVTVPPPYSLSRPSGMRGALLSAAEMLGVEFGMHGYDPTLPDMGGIFLAMGRGVPKDLTLERVHQTDVAATVAKLLEIDPPMSSEGEPIW